MRFYTAKYCNDCGDKISDIQSGLLADRRFCSLCAANKEMVIWFPRFLFAIVLFVGTTGCIGWIAIVSGRDLLPAKKETLSVKTIGNDRPAEVMSEKDQVVALHSASVESKQDTLKGSEPKIEKQAPLELKKSENVYYCGAMTKKGTPCSRRVKTQTRCYQHVGKPSMHPEK